MFNLFNKTNKQQTQVTNRKEGTRVLVYRFTEQDDIRIIKGIVGNKSMREVADGMGLTKAQIQHRVAVLKNKGLRISRLNNTQTIVSMSILNRNAFKENPKFLKEVEKLINKVVVKRELNCIKNGEVQTTFHTWKAGELGAMKFYGSMKSVDEYAKLLKRDVNDIRKKFNEMN